MALAQKTPQVGDKYKVISKKECDRPFYGKVGEFHSVNRHWIALPTETTWFIKFGHRIYGFDVSELVPVN